MHDQYLLRKLTELTGCGYLVLDEALRIVECSPAIERLSQVKAASASGQRIDHLFPQLAESRDALLELMENSDERRFFRIRPEPTLFLKITAGSVDSEIGEGRLLLILEDISVLVFRTDILKRRIQNLDTRCQALESEIAGDGAGEPIQHYYETHTGLFDEPYIQERLVEEDAASRRWKQPLSNLVIHVSENQQSESSLDDWQIIHDLSQVLKHTVRSTDILGSLGSQGFVIILPQTPLDQAELVARRVTALIEKDITGEFKFSVGLAQMDDRNDTGLKMFKRAKAAAEISKARVEKQAKD